jgi:hypothetical protein
MDDLVTWLRARLDARERELDEDARVASAALLSPSASLAAQLGMSLWEPRDIGGPEMPSVCEGTAIVASKLADEHAAHIARWDPAHVLRKVATERAEVDAQRRILERPGPVCDCSESDPPMDPETRWTTPLPHHFDCASYETAKLLALPCADRAGYREDWRPE